MGTSLGVPVKKDPNISGSILGSLYLGKLSCVTLPKTTNGRIQGIGFWDILGLGFRI